MQRLREHYMGLSVNPSGCETESGSVIWLLTSWIIASLDIQQPRKRQFGRQVITSHKKILAACLILVPRNDTKMNIYLHFQSYIQPYIHNVQRNVKIGMRVLDLIVLVRLLGGVVALGKHRFCKCLHMSAVIFNCNIIIFRVRCCQWKL